MVNRELDWCVGRMRIHNSSAKFLFMGLLLGLKLPCICQLLLLDNPLARVPTSQENFIDSHSGQLPNLKKRKKKKKNIMGFSMKRR